MPRNVSVTVGRLVGVLPAGERAGSGLVGVLVPDSELTLLNAGDASPIPGMFWDGSTYRVNGDNVIVENLLINGTTIGIFNNSHTIIRNCKVVAPFGAFHAIYTDTGVTGTALIEDCTVTCVGNPTGPTQLIGTGISVDIPITIRRCDVSLVGDGIHITAYPGTIISQCYLHNLKFVDETQHQDGIQVFSPVTTGGNFTVEHSRVEASFSSTGTPMNSALTCGLPADTTEPRIGVTLNNNFWGSGLYNLRCEFRLENVGITNCDWGPIGLFDYFIVEQASTVLLPGAAGWDNNRDENGNLLARPTN